jgi:transketolase
LTVRNTFIEELVTLARANPKIALIVGDLGYSVVEPFADEFPERFINAGVAEQNMMGLAAGMASEGHHVFVYSIANFPTFRCAEQIRNDVAYHGLSVTVVSVGGGLAYGNLGYSHHAVQDYGLMRLFPGMLIAAPGDPTEVRACMRYLTNHPQPSYLRLGKTGERHMHANVPEVSPGQWLEVEASQDADQLILTTGAALQWARQELGADGSAALYSMPLWSMTSRGQQAFQMKPWQTVTTFEDHLLDGGFGSWLLESLVTEPEQLRKLSVRALHYQVCGLVGKQDTLNRIGWAQPSDSL